MEPVRQANSYPARLEAELESETGVDFDVKNAGIGGELAAKTLERLRRALKSGWARLVIWQVGTNDALVGVDEALFRATVQAGIAAARAAGIPMMLIGPQFTLKSPDPARYERFVKMIDDIGAADHVPVLSRYTLMKSWRAQGAKAVGLLLSRDGLHMSDLGYRCLAHALAEAIESLRLRPSFRALQRAFSGNLNNATARLAAWNGLGRRLWRHEFWRLLMDPRPKPIPCGR